MENKNNISLFNASAGSGKTFQLVLQYLTKALKTPDENSFQRILALTFTNKAAGEMKGRILDWLDLLSNIENKDEIVFKSLVKATSLSNETLCNRAYNLRSSILHNYDRFAVSTIDAFNYSIITCFSNDLGLTAQTNLEMDNSAYLQEAVDILLKSTAKDKLLKSFLLLELKQSMKEGSSWRVSDKLKEDLAKLVQDVNHYHTEDYKKYSLSFFADLRKDFFAEKRTLENEVIEIGAAYLEMLSDNQLEIADVLNGVRGISGFFLKLSNKIIAPPTESNYKVVNNGVFSKKKSPKEDKIASISTKIVELFKESDVKIKRLIEIKVLLKKSISLALMNELNKILDEIKRDRQIIFISDLNKLILENLKKQPSEYIYEKIGQRFSTFFIDEFQDTSKMQWENMLPLIDEKKSLGQDIILVGDLKQAIYRFRGGSSDIMMNLSLEDDTFLHTLEFNYRSKKAIVEFNNDFYNHISEKFLKSPQRELYQKGITQSIINKDGGHVSLDYLKSENRTVDEDNILNQILLKINKLLGADYPLKDICILVRNAKKSELVANLLLDNNIPVSTAESLFLSKNLEVQVIVSLLQLIDNPEDEALKVEFILLLSQNHSLVLKKDFSKFLIYFKTKNLDQIFSFLNEKGYQFEDDILRSNNLFSITKKLVLGLKINPHSFINSFLEVIFKFSSKPTDNLLSDFLLEWEEQKEKIKLSATGKGNAVQIMTMHKCKGLEFPVVILPFFSDSSPTKTYWIDYPDFPFDNYLIEPTKDYKPTSKLVEKQFEEYKSQENTDVFNLLYVATTRAKEQMHFIICEKSNDDKADFLRDYIKGENIEFAESITLFGSSYPKKKEEKADAEDKSIAIGNSKLSWPKELKYSLDKIALLEGKHSFTERGNAWHSLLAKLYSKEDKEKIIQINKSLSILSEDDSKELPNVLDKILSHPILKDYFKKELISFNERTFITKGGLEKKPDRLVETQNGFALIDYKTGEINKAYKKQIYSYVDDLNSLGFTIENAYLVYLDCDIEVVKVL